MAQGDRAMKRLIAVVVLFLAAVASAGAPKLKDRAAVSADGVKIHYRVGGKGSPALVFVHCWSCDAGYWREQLPVFARDHKVVAIDLAGHGSSGDNRQRFTMAAFGADVAAVVKREELERIVLIGHSMGGPVVLEAAQLLPGTVALVVGVDNMQNVEMKFPEEFFKQLHDGMMKDFRTTTDAFVRSMFPKDASPKLVADVAGDMASAPPHVAISAIEEIKGFDDAKAMELAGVPVVCINSTTYPTAVEVNRKHAKSFDVVLVEGVGHFLMLEKPQAFNAALAQVLAERGLGPAAR
jgi:pimeloyl-ACP methyl ester carboxylesterase